MTERRADELERYRRAAEDALEQLDWCIGYLHGIRKVDISRALAKNRAHIRTQLLRRRRAAVPAQQTDETNLTSGEGTSDMAVAQRAAGGYARATPRPSGLAEVIDIILDKGLVIDAYVRVSLIGIEILTIDARIVIASVDTYLRFAEAVGRLDLAGDGRLARACPS